MSLRFLIGTAGTGKTHLCMQEIITQQKTQKGKQLYIVPEQFTSQAERDLTALTEKRGILTAEVLSFGRLAYQVLTKEGLGNRIPLDEIGKNMALTRILLSHEEEFSYFRHLMDKNGFIDQLGLTITEFFRYSIPPEALEACSQQKDLSQTIQAKLKDMTLIYKSYKEFLQQDYISSDETLTILSHKLAERIAPSSFASTEIWLDGFHGFTPQEYHVIAALLPMVKRITVTLPMDEGSYHLDFLPPSAAFFEPKLTKDKLLHLAEEAGVSVESPVFLRKNFRAHTPSLQFLEENYFHGYYKKSSQSEGITICSCATRQEEVAYAAGKINFLVREQGLRYRDIAIVTNAMDTYKHHLQGILEEYHIPCFLDTRRDISAHPLLLLLQGLLDTLLYDFRYEGIFSYLKSGLTPIEHKDLDVLENYVLAYGIKGYKWRKDLWTWGFQAGEEKEQAYINRLKEEVLAPFRHFKGLTGKKEYPLRKFADALIHQLEELGVEEKLASMAETELSEGNPQKAEEHRQIMQIVIHVLEKAVEILGDTPMTFQTFSRILQAGLEKSSLGMIPPTVDCLVVGDLERSRLPQIKVLFVLGVNEGILPSPVAPQGIFTEIERKALTETGIELAPDSKRKLFEEQFLIYRGLTKPSQMLFLTYANGDTQGRSLFPSSLIDRIRRMYPTLETETAHTLTLSTLSPAACFHHLGSYLRDAREGIPIPLMWQDIYSFFCKNPLWQERLSLLHRGMTAHIRQEKLSPKVTKALYGDNILTSISRLERFASCPFSYFAEYGLRAKERKLYQLKTPDLGLLFHSVLEEFSNELAKENINWQNLSREETERRIETAVDAAAPLLGNEILLDSAANRYLIKRLKRISKRAAWTLVQHIQKGLFVPTGYEVGFGPKEALPPIVISMENGSKLILRGKIDRIDLLNENGEKFVKIIDYKSGNKTFHFQDIYYGLQLQLLLYLDAYLHLHENTELPYRPGGVFYFRVADPTISISAELPPEKISHMLYEKMQMSGLVLNHPSVIQGMDRAFVNEETGETIYGASSIIPLKYTKKGEPTASSYLATEEEYQTLMRFAAKRAASIGESMKKGVIKPSPYRKKDMTPCDYCKYAPLCRYDYIGRPYYRDLKKMDKTAFWEEIMPKKKDTNKKK